MDRQKLAFAAMKPMDVALGAAVSALEASGRMESLTDRLYGAARTVVRDLLDRGLDLHVEGADHLPAAGGVLLAANHQSWLDVEALGATCPRRLRFVAKDEFHDWPVLRHLIALSGSPMLHRGGDLAGMSAVTRALSDGQAIAIFPEGTIPGEEDRARTDVEPDTGLLRGHTGAVRMALAARVPIVPVGISGSGRVLPPEVYPRLELFEVRREPVTVRFGAPMTFEELYDHEPTLDELREATRRLMKAISGLVDHERNYVPLKLPIRPLPRFEKLGVLLLHGLTADAHAVEGMVPVLEQAGVHHRVPRLRPYGARLMGLKSTAQDWYDDAETALLALAKEVDKVVVIGFSMGGLLAINLGIRHPDKIAGVVTLAAPLRLRSFFSPVVPLLARVLRSLPAPHRFNDPELAADEGENPRLMTDALVSLLHYAELTEEHLPELKVPICVLHSKADSIVDPVSANLIYRAVGSAHREIHWFQKSGHELGRDLEHDEVFRRALEFVLRFKAARPEQLAKPS